MLSVGRGGDEQAMTVAHHPHFTADTAKDDSRTRQAVFGMFSKTRQHGLFVVFADVCRYPTEKLLTGGCLRHFADVAADQLHRIAAIGT